MANVSQQAMQYYELIRQGVSPQEAFKQAFPNGIPTAEDRAREAAKKQQEANIGGVGGMLAGALGTDYLVSSMVDKPSIVGSLFSGGATEPALSYTAGTIPEAVGGVSSAGEGISALASGGEAFGGGGASIGTGGAELASTFNPALAAVPIALFLAARTGALKPVGKALANAFQDNTESSRQFDDRIDLAGLAQQLPNGANLSENQLRQIGAELDSQGLLDYRGFKRIADPTEENPLGSIDSALPAMIRNDRVMKRLEHGSRTDNQYRSGMEYLNDLYSGGYNSALNRYQGMMAPEGYEGRRGQDFINELGQYSDPNTTQTYRLPPMGEPAPIPTPEQVQAEMAGQGMTPTPRPTPAQGVGTPSPQFTPEEIKNIGSFGQDLASNYRNMGQALQSALGASMPQLPERSKTRSPGIDMYGNRIRY